MENTYYTEEQLNSESLIFLRSYAREIGGTPSLKNKEELVQYILDIQSGKITPKRSKSGRKPLNVLGSDYKLFTLLKGKSAFGSEEEELDGYGVICEDSRYGGVLEILPEGVGVLSEREGGKTVFVPQSLIDGLKLRSGDRIEGEYEIGYNNAIVVSSVLSLNGREPFAVGERLHFEKEPSVYPNTKISFADMGFSGKTIDLFSPIGKGQRAIMVLPKFSDETEFIESLSTSLEINGVVPLVSYINCRPEDKNLLGEVIKELFSTSFDEDKDMHESVFRRAEERAVRLAETGYDVALIVGSFSAAKEVLQDFNSEVKRLLNMAKNTKNCNSVTVIVLTDDMDCAAQYENYCNATVVIEGSLVDPLKSFTRRGGTLLTTDEADVADAVRKCLLAGKDKSFIEKCLSDTKDSQEFVSALKDAANLP